MKIIRLLLAIVVIIVPMVSWALDNKPVVWVDHDVSLVGKLISEVLPATDETGTHIPEPRLREIQSTLNDTLMANGVLLSNANKENKGNALVAKVSVTSFKTGDAIGRWFGFGAGAAKCTIRVQLLDKNSVVVADVIDTRIVDTGGFFTIGADSSFHKDLVKELADTITKILKNGRGKK